MLALHTCIIPSFNTLGAHGLFSFVQWKANLASMSRVAAGQSLSVNQLVDMEWRFGGKLANESLSNQNTFWMSQLYSIVC